MSPVLYLKVNCIVCEVTYYAVHKTQYYTGCGQSKLVKNVLLALP